MTVLVLPAGTAVAIAAAVRSTWSPCGLSVLSSITPLAERGRGRRFRSTAVWYISGAVLGGACLGTVMAAMAAGVEASGTSARFGLVLIAGAAVVSAASDLGLGRVHLPVHHRQVNEMWLDRFRPWVYGMGFGWQIGSGFATYITTTGVYLLVALGALSGDPAWALGLGMLFGTVRGLAVILGRSITSPETLVGFHRRFSALGPAANRTMVAVTGVVAVAAAVAAWWPAGIALAVAGLACVVRGQARFRVRLRTPAR